METRQLIFLDGPIKDSKAAIMDDNFSACIIVPFSSKTENGERKIIYAKYYRHQNNQFKFYANTDEREYLDFRNINGN